MNFDIFEGRKVPSSFVSHLELFLSLDETTKQQVVNKVFELLDKKGANTELEMWLKEKDEDQRIHLLNSYKLVYFIITSAFLKRYTREKFTALLKDLGFEPSFVEFILAEQGKHSESLKEAVKEAEIELFPKIGDISWRIDIIKKSIYFSDANEISILIKLILTDNENKEIVLDLTLEEIQSLLRTLTQIQEEAVSIKE